MRGALGDTERARETSTTPPSATRLARCAPAGASLQTFTAAPEELHRSGTLSRSGTPRWRTREEQRPNRLPMPRDALLACLSDFRLLAFPVIRRKKAKLWIISPIHRKSLLAMASGFPIGVSPK